MKPVMRRAISTALAGSSKTSIKLISAHQLARTLPENDLIMMVDAFDVVFQVHNNTAMQPAF